MGHPMSVCDAVAVHYGQRLRRDVAVGRWHSRTVSSVFTAFCAFGHLEVCSPRLRCVSSSRLPQSLGPEIEREAEETFLEPEIEREAEETFPLVQHQTVCKLMLSLPRTGVRPRQRQRAQS